MFMNVVCPHCNHRCRVAESMLGKPVVCPGCSRQFQCGSRTERHLRTSPCSVEQIAATRAASSSLPNSIHFRCVSCNATLQSPPEMAAQKVSCPQCGQRLQIPGTPPQPQVPVKLVHPPVQLVQPFDSGQSQAAPKPKKRRRKDSISSGSGSIREEHCLECGVDISGRPRVQTCPDCSAVFCSARCFREHRFHAHPHR